MPVVYRPRPFLLTKNEAAFFRVLSALVADYYQISCKVRLADIVTCDDADWKRGQANRISQKHLDFVVSFIDSSRIVAAIELDDSSHERPERRARDAFLNRLFWQIDVRLIRVPALWKYDADEIAAHLTRAGLLMKRGRLGHVDGRFEAKQLHGNGTSSRDSFGGAESRKPSGGRRRW